MEMADAATYLTWSFGVLTTVSVVALALTLPQPPKLSSVLIGGVILGVVVALGLLAAAPFDRGTPIIRQLVEGQPFPVSQLGTWALAAGAGALVGGAVLAVLVCVFIPLEPKLATRLAAQASQPIWRPWAVSFSAAVLEEVALRLFLMSGAIWLLSRVWGPAADQPRPAVFWAALIISAAAFGLIHLPSWFAVVRPTPVLVAAVMLLNGIAGLALGAVYWQVGIGAAMVFHFAADMVVQGIGPRLVTR